MGHVIGCAESWSLRVSGQAFANDVCVSCLVISLAALNAGACGYLGRRLLMMSSVFSCLVMSLAALNPGACGYLGRRLLMMSSVFSCLVTSLAALNPGACGYLGRRLLMMSSVFHVWSCHWLRSTHTDETPPAAHPALRHHFPAPPPPRPGRALLPRIATYRNPHGREPRPHLCIATPTMHPVPRPHG